MIGFREAQAAVLETAGEPLGVESIALETALGRVAAQAVVAKTDLVAFARSAMDGYAVRTADTLRANAEDRLRLEVVQTLFAEAGSATHRPGTATGIATGTPIPHGADAVIPFELVERDGNTIEISAPARVGENVFPPGEDAHAGEQIVAVGQTLTPASLGLAGVAGSAQISVFVRPRVAIVSTGDELVEIGEEPQHGQVRNSNAPMLATMVRDAGGDVVAVRKVADVPAALRDALAQALEEADLVITTGGASAGPRDFVKATLRELGVRFAFESIALRPARPTGFGRRERTLVAVLPGNPAAAFVGFAEFVRPALLRIAGFETVLYPEVPAILEGDIHAKATRTYLVFGSLRHDGGRFVANPIVNQCSAIVRTAADANCLIVLEPREGTLETGDSVAVHVLDWNRVAFSSVAPTPRREPARLR
ncbi:MAG: molybdopterin molybdotransferase MoeA [Candidatus Eremiobacteraeota bacterium]|nr:molybdopterin molybdotransferase MoeA [Candidatus Eremiobacteraeota bacterium]